MVLVLYVGGENYQTDRDDAMRWLWGSKDHMVHRRVRRLGMRIWRIRYPLAYVPARFQWTDVLTMTMAVTLSLAALGLLLIKWGPPQFNTQWWRRVFSYGAMAAGALVGLLYYWRYYLVTGDPARSRGIHASQPVYSEQVDAVAAAIERKRRKHGAPTEQVVLVGNGSGGHLVALYVLRLIFARHNQRGQWPKWLRAVFTSNCVYDVEQYVRHSTLLEEYTRKCIVEPAFGASQTTWRSASPMHHWIRRRPALMPPELKERWFVCADLWGAGQSELALQARQFALDVLQMSAASQQLVVAPQMQSPSDSQYFQLLSSTIN